MLKQRLVTAAVMLVVFGLLVAFSSSDVFALFVSLVVAAAAWEWSRLAGVKDENAQTGYAIVVGLVAMFCLYSPLVDSAARWVMLIGLLFWGAALVQFYLAAKLPAIESVSVPLLVTGIGVLAIAAISIQYLRSYAPAASSWLLLYAMAVVWVMDVGAYFSGRRFGRVKLAPSISPGKTREGVYGGLMCAALLFLIVLFTADWADGAAWRLLFATLFAAAISVIGDLYESRLKRAAGIKDSSQMLPGHGGVLDRIDGVIAALPVFSFFWAWM